MRRPPNPYAYQSVVGRSESVAPRLIGDRALPGSLLARSSSRHGFRPTPARVARNEALGARRSGAARQVRNLPTRSRPYEGWGFVLEPFIQGVMRFKLSHLDAIDGRTRLAYFTDVGRRH